MNFTINIVKKIGNNAVDILKETHLARELKNSTLLKTGPNGKLSSYELKGEFPMAMAVSGSLQKYICGLWHMVTP